MKKTLDFLRELKDNNNREWFEAHKPLYREIQAKFNVLAEQLIDGIASFDPTVKGLMPKDTMYRIYRDVRFSANKDPYKTHMGIYVCRGGKKSGYAGYYFHVEPDCREDEKGEYTESGGAFVSSGIYMPELKVLKSLRDEVYDNGEAVVKAIKKAKGFTLDKVNSLKRLPKGYETGEYDELMKLKDIYVFEKLDEKFLLQDNLVQAVVKEFHKTHDLVELLNRAVTYAHEEM